MQPTINYIMIQFEKGQHEKIYFTSQDYKHDFVINFGKIREINNYPSQVVSFVASVSSVLVTSNPLLM